MGVLRRDYLLPDLRETIVPAGVSEAMLVQAQQTVDDTRWLLAIADRDDLVAGVVGWVPLADPSVDDVLALLRLHPKLRGIRHIVHDEPDDRFLLREDFNRGVARLRGHGFVYDILIFAKHLPYALEFVDRHPLQPFVLDHIGKPVIRGERFDTGWERGFRALAKRPHVTCKLSGVVTEVRDPAWTPALLRRYLDVALEAFGPDRLMFGSDWPVCRLRATYAEWLSVVQRLIAPLSVPERTAIGRGTAARVYGLEA
jgi:L-fuconolactonase